MALSSPMPKLEMSPKLNANFYGQSCLNRQSHKKAKPESAVEITTKKDTRYTRRSSKKSFANRDDKIGFENWEWDARATNSGGTLTRLARKPQRKTQFSVLFLWFQDSRSKYYSSLFKTPRVDKNKVFIMQKETPPPSFAPSITYGHSQKSESWPSILRGRSGLRSGKVLTVEKKRSGYAFINGFCKIS